MIWNATVRAMWDIVEERLNTENNRPEGLCKTEKKKREREKEEMKIRKEEKKENLTRGERGMAGIHTFFDSDLAERDWPTIYKRMLKT